MKKNATKNAFVSLWREEEMKNRSGNTTGQEKGLGEREKKGCCDKMIPPRSYLERGVGEEDKSWGPAKRPLLKPET